MTGEEARACANGHAVSTEAKFCPECGALVGKPAATAAVEETLHFDSGAHGSPTPPTRRQRKLLPVLLIPVLVIGLAATGVWFAKFRVTTDDRYVAALRQAGLYRAFGNRDAAVAQGRAFCSTLSAGKKPRGYKSQAIAVEYYCDEFAQGFVVVPTPAEQQRKLTAMLRNKGLGGKFASDAAAVAHARSVCTRLATGGSQQGPIEDQVAVAVYCPKYESGFEILRPIHVKGSFDLMDDDPSSYYPSITGSDNNCEGDNGYSDISFGTEVVVKDNSGKVLTTTSLGPGRGLPPFSCKFKFSFTVMDGSSGGYSITVADRGELHYTAAQLKIPGSVAISLGG